VSSTGRVVTVAATRRGAYLAMRLAAALPDAELHVASRWQSLVPDATPVDEPLAEALPRLFRGPSVRGLVVVLAVGATVRLLAPWLRGKEQDPAVVCVDEAGRFAVAVLSGHRGGANALAQRVADALGARAVITTASDAAGVLAVDLLGADQGWKIVATPRALRCAAAALVNGDPVGVYQDAGERGWCEDVGVPDTVRVVADLGEPEVGDLAALLVITDRVLALPTSVTCQVVYRPPTLVAGIGCSLGATCEDIASTVDLALAQGSLARASVAELATIDRRLKEPGIVAYAHQARLEVRGFAAETLAAVPRLPRPSPVVQAAVGTPGVCEPAALLASGAATLLVPKVKTQRVTAAIARIAAERASA